MTDHGLVCSYSREKSASKPSLQPSMSTRPSSLKGWRHTCGATGPCFTLQAHRSAWRLQALEPYLERAHQAHHACLLGILKVLVDGYEGDYLQTENVYSYAKRGGERYRLLAFEPKYFPGSGFLEPLGVVHAARNADLLRVGWVRARVLDAVVAALERRAADGGDPLKLNR